MQTVGINGVAMQCGLCVRDEVHAVANIALTHQHLLHVDEHWRHSAQHRVAEGLAGVVGGGGPLVDVVLGVCTFF